MANRRQAAFIASTVERRLLRQGGLVTTPVRTGQQWDAPNGWAPLQWIAVAGLRRYGHDGLARSITERWLHTVCRVYAETGKLLEKYDVTESKPGGGGEYPLQDGFGWTNGVTVALLELYSDSTEAGPDCG
jgi:alpha,alpha-trehalase